MFHIIQYVLWMDLSPGLVSDHTSLQRVAAALMMASPVYRILMSTQTKSHCCNALERIYAMSGRLMRAFVRGEVMKGTFLTHHCPKKCHCCLCVLKYV